MSEQLLCGAAREVITPPAEMIDHLSGLMNSSFGGVVDDLYVRVIALEYAGKKMLLVSFDLDKAACPKENLEALEKQNTYALQTLRWIGYHGIGVILLEQGRKCFIFRNGDRCIWFVITCHDVNAFVEQGHEIGRKQCLELMTEVPEFLRIDRKRESVIVDGADDDSAHKAFRVIGQLF